MNVVELAFIAQDPAGEYALALAREVLILIRNRDDADCLALASELRALRLKYQPHNTTRSGDPWPPTKRESHNHQQPTTEPQKYK
jgi:hypothetical protein